MARPEAQAYGTDGQPDSSSTFTFVDRSLDLASGEVLLNYALDGIELVERFWLPDAPLDIAEERWPAIEAALDLLHWVAGVSYWKAGCPSTLRFDARSPDRWQAQWLTALYRHGLAEFAFENDLDPDGFPEFPSSDALPHGPSSFAVRRRTLVPMGGGKDSLVAWERLRSRGESPDSIQVGQAPLILALGDQLPGKHRVIRRRVDARLSALNRAGALNGHVPVTAINSAVLLLAAIVLDYDRIAFANERSASEASRLDVRGRAVNHQFSKSFDFECMLDDWVKRYVHDLLRVFSILRRDRELAICREFARHTLWHQHFSS
ncbi:MAG: endonuclease domain-containing protein, partial [Pseudomonadota bacterium]